MPKIPATTIPRRGSDPGSGSDSGSGSAERTAAAARAARGSDLSDLIRRQHGVLSAAQAAANAVPHETLRQRILRGIWQRLLPGIYVLQCGPPTQLQWSIAALLYAGDGSMLTGPAALAEHRFLPPDGSISPAAPHIPATPPTHGPAPAHATAPAAATIFPTSGTAYPATCGAAPAPVPAFTLMPTTSAAPPRLDILVPHRVRRQSTAGIRIIRTTHLPEPIEAGPLRLAPLAKAVVDSCLAAVEAGRTATAEALVTAALADGRVSLAELEEELGRAPRRFSSALRAQLAGQRASAKDAASSRLLAALGSIGPFGSLRDVAVYAGDRRVALAAALWPTRAVAAAVDAPEHEVKTLSNLGFAVVQIAPQRVAQDLRGVLRQVGDVLMDRPEATLPVGVSLLPRASAAGSPAVPAQRRNQRVLTASSPARTGCASVLPRGGTGHT